MSSFLQTRLDLLRQSQNQDGGWGYFPGKQSWLEPSVYASLALFGEPEAERAWQLLSTWQNPDGSWKPGQEVSTSTWATALCVTLAALRQESGRPLQTGAAWLLDTEGGESSLKHRPSRRLPGTKQSPGENTKGWSWTPHAFSSPEPTAHALIALRKAARLSPAIHTHTLTQRLKQGENRLLACTSPESMGFVLLGLQGNKDLEPWLEPARREAAGDQTPALKRTWLRLALRLHGESLPPAKTSCSNDLMLAALEALAEEDGNYKLLQSAGTGATL